MAIIVLGCASKRYAKKGAKYETAGYYDKAAEMYYIAVTKNEKNVDAQIGLKKNGQIYLTQQLEKFQKHFDLDETKDAVYAYIEADNWYNKTKSLGCQLDFPSDYRDSYASVKNNYLQTQYEKAVVFLDNEQFIQAENIFNEIIAIDANYNDVNQLRVIAHYEPIYRLGVDLFNNNKNRAAYYKFSKICTETGDYKQSREMLDKALEKALLTIAVLDFENRSRTKDCNVIMQQTIKKQLTELKSPFIKIVDRENTNTIKNEQLLTIEGKVDGTVSAQAGKMLGVKVLLAGRIESYSAHVSGKKVEDVKAYLREKKVEKVKDTEREIIKYHKITYKKISQSVNVSCRFSYQFISTETGQILVSDIVSLNQNDNVLYAQFDGNIDNLVPGYWENENSASAKDQIFDNDDKIRELKSSFKSRKNLQSVETLYENIVDQTAKSVCQKILKYDPEK